MTQHAGTAGGFDLRPMAGADLAGVLELNQASTPEVGDLDAGRLAALVDVAELALVAVPRNAVGAPGGAVRSRVGDGPAGFVIALGPGRDYGSPNYRFFDAGPADFLYVDRIAVAPWAHRSGLGRALYGEVVAAARALGRSRVTCEVNVQPPNPGSQAFHAALGFVEVGRQWTYGDTVEVQLLQLDVP
ncbi:MAG: GNAT family N-acetyltransferase [Microthrixaceae bacterium]